MPQNKNLKRNPWPVAIIGTLILFFAGTISLVVLACSQRVDLVSPDYYEQEIRFQDQIERHDRTQRLGAQASVTYNAADRRITISLPAEQTQRVTRGHIQLYRPSAADLDRKIALHLDGNGIQSLDAAELRPGLWKVRVSWTVEDKEYLIDQKVLVGGSSPPPGEPTGGTVSQGASRSR